MPVRQELKDKRRRCLILSYLFACSVHILTQPGSSVNVSETSYADFKIACFKKVLGWPKGFISNLGRNMYFRQFFNNFAHCSEKINLYRTSRNFHILTVISNAKRKLGNKSLLQYILWETVELANHLKQTII